MIKRFDYTLEILGRSLAAHGDVDFDGLPSLNRVEFGIDIQNVYPLIEGSPLADDIYEECKTRLARELADYDAEMSETCGLGINEALGQRRAA